MSAANLHSSNHWLLRDHFSNHIKFIVPVYLSHRTYQPRMTLIPLLPDNYVQVCEAGRGISSRVYFCLSRRAIKIAADANPITRESAGFDGLKRSIIAVKVSSMKRLTQQEHNALQAIRQCDTPNVDEMRKHFLDIKEIGEFGSAGDTYSYITLEAIIPSVTLEALLQECAGNVKAPIPLVYHFFLSLVSAVLFLRDSVQWAHNDLKEDNIMCRMYEGCPFEMPWFVLIDFGMAYDISAVKNDSGDVKNALALVSRLAENAEDSMDLQWRDFKRRVDGERHRTRWQVDDEIGKIWEAWRDVSVKKRAERKKFELDWVDEIFQKAAEKKGRITGEMVLEAAQR